jgi:hypothetical protein
MEPVLCGQVVDDDDIVPMAYYNQGRCYIYKPPMIEKIMNLICHALSQYLRLHGIIDVAAEPSWECTTENSTPMRLVKYVFVNERQLFFYATVRRYWLFIVGPVDRFNRPIERVRALLPVPFLSDLNVSMLGTQCPGVSSCWNWKEFL